MRYFAYFLLLVLSIACAPSASEPTAGAGTDVAALRNHAFDPLPSEQRWIIAVPDFNVRASSFTLRDEQVQDRDPAFFVEIGTGVADIFVNEAFRSGQFRITERSEITQILREQELGEAGRVDPQTAASVGRITGAELLVLGSLTEFGVTSAGGGGRVFGLFGGGTEVVTARVSVDIRFVDAETAEILAIGGSTAEVSQRSVEFDVFNVIQGLRAGRTGTTIVDIAVRNAIVGAINDGVRNLPEKPVNRQR